MAGRKKTPSNSKAKKTAAKTPAPKNQKCCRTPVSVIAGGMVVARDGLPDRHIGRGSRERLGRYLKTINGR